MKGGSRSAGGAVISCGLALAVVLLLAASLQLPAAESAVTCNPSELLPCSSAFFSSTPPSAACCAKVREQQPCFCQYLRDPSLRPYANSPNTRRVAAACGVSFPRC